jgi:hypothetical protein
VLHCCDTQKTFKQTFCLYQEPYVEDVEDTFVSGCMLILVKFFLVLELTAKILNH